MTICKAIGYFYTLLGSLCSFECQLFVLISSGPLQGQLCQDMEIRTFMFGTIKVQIIIEIMMSSSSSFWWTSVWLLNAFCTASGSQCSVGCRSYVLTCSGPLRELLCQDMVSNILMSITILFKMITESWNPECVAIAKPDVGDLLEMIRPSISSLLLWNKVPYTVKAAKCDHFGLDSNW